MPASNLYLRTIKRIAFAYNSHRGAIPIYYTPQIYIIFPIAQWQSGGHKSGAASQLGSPVYKFKLASSTFAPALSRGPTAGDLALGICQESVCRCFNAKTSLHSATWLICPLISGYLCEPSQAKPLVKSQTIDAFLGGASSRFADLFIFPWARFSGVLLSFLGLLFAWQHDNYTLRMFENKLRCQPGLEVISIANYGIISIWNRVRLKVAAIIHFT